MLPASGQRGFRLVAPGTKLLEVFSGYTDGEVVAGGTASFSVDVYDAPDCAAVAVGASGYGF